MNITGGGAGAPIKTDGFGAGAVGTPPRLTRSIAFAVAAIAAAFLGAVAPIYSYDLALQISGPIPHVWADLVSAVVESIPLVLVAVIIVAAADQRIAPRRHARNAVLAGLAVFLVWRIFGVLASASSGGSVGWEGLVGGRMYTALYLTVTGVTATLLAAAWILGHRVGRNALIAAPVCGALVAAGEYVFWVHLIDSLAENVTTRAGAIGISALATALSVAIFVGCMWLARALSR